MAKKYFPILFLIIIIFISCDAIQEPGLNNPVDPYSENQGYIIPKIDTLIGPDDGVTIKDHTVSFAWKGSESTLDFCFNLDGNSWSNWSSDTSVTFRFLDEGEHIFQVKGRSSAEEIETPITAVFYVDAIQGPALMMVPRKVILNEQENFEVEIFAEEVENLSGLSFVIPYEKSELQLTEATIYKQEKSILTKDGGTVLNIVENDANNQILEVSLGRVSDDQPGINGTGALMRLSFQYNGANDFIVRPSQVIFQSPDRGEIEVNEVTGCNILIK